jgi:hypothetical protein
VIVTPATVLRWQRRRFRAYWTRLSARPTGGRLPVNAQIKAPDGAWNVGVDAATGRRGEVSDLRSAFIDAIAARYGPEKGDT